MSDNATELSLDDRIAAAFGDGVKSGDVAVLIKGHRGGRLPAAAIGEALGKPFPTRRADQSFGATRPSCRETAGLVRQQPRLYGDGGLRVFGEPTLCCGRTPKISNGLRVARWPTLSWGRTASRIRFSSHLAISCARTPISCVSCKSNVIPGPKSEAMHQS
jgi:hypothetical protein